MHPNKAQIALLNFFLLFSLPAKQRGGEEGNKNFNLHFSHVRSSLAIFFDASPAKFENKLPTFSRFVFPLSRARCFLASLFCLIKVRATAVVWMFSPRLGASRSSRDLNSRRCDRNWFREKRLTSQLLLRGVLHFARKVNEISTL